MKRIIIICMLFIPQISFSQSTELTRKEIMEAVCKVIADTSYINVHVSVSPLIANTTIATMYKPFSSPENKSWFIFIDEHPFESWWHGCKYVFIDFETHEIIKFDMRYPPALAEMRHVKEMVVELEDVSVKPPVKYRETTKNTFTSSNEWAVIINGGYDTYNNWQRYWNHCSFVYSTLINEYGYQKSHIFVLMSDGTSPSNDRHLINGTYDSSPLDLDGDGIGDIQYAATRSNVNIVFDILADSLDSSDNLFIYTTDHGGQTSGQNVHICLWGENMEDYEFAQQVNKVNAGKINACLVQCHSGGFVGNLQGTNRVITTSCAYNESAHAMNNLLYSEFTYYWTSALAGQTPGGTTVNANSNGDGYISMSEAFNYANYHDTKQETPQYSSTPSTLGASLSLIGLIPSISGPTTLCSSGGSYSISNVPSGAAITWSCGSDIQRQSAQGANPCTFRSIGDGDSYVQATITYNGQNLTLPNYSVYSGIPPAPPEVYASNVDGSNGYYTKILNSGTAYFTMTNTPSFGKWWDTQWATSTTHGGDDYYLDIDADVLGSNYVLPYWTNVCGNSAPGPSVILEVVLGKSANQEEISFGLSPNPADQYVDIKLELPEDMKMVDTYWIEFVNPYSIVAKKVELDGAVNRVSVADLPKGYYVVKLLLGKDIYTNKLVIE